MASCKAAECLTAQCTRHAAAAPGLHPPPHPQKSTPALTILVVVVVVQELEEGVEEAARGGALLGRQAFAALQLQGS